MKRTFTLFTLALACIGSNAQINQGFESNHSLTQLANACWQFSNIGFSNTAQLNGNNSLFMAPVTTATTSAVAITPYITLNSGSAIDFVYRLSHKLSTNADRTIVVSLQAFDGTRTLLSSTALNRNTPTTAQTISAVSPVAGVYKIVIEIFGSGDGNSSIYVDDFQAAGNFNYSSPYDCSANSLLPVQLKSFRANLQSKKVQLTWEVSGNQSGDYFEVEKSADGHSFATAAVIATTEKQGDEAYTYAQTLETAAWFRLKTIHKNKTVVYSAIVAVKHAVAATDNVLMLLQNPVRQSLSFNLTANRPGIAEANVYNLQGVRVLQTKITVQKGLNALNTDLQKVNGTGNFILEVKTAEGRSVARFVKD